MKVYLAIVEDRHIDTEVEVFVDSHSAVSFAREVATNSCADPSEMYEEEIAEWLFYIVYSNEGDSVRVVEREVKGIHK